MEIKEIRAKTGLSQAEFSKKYNIPLDTLRGWESNPGSTRYRQCPSYVISLLHRVVSSDYE